MTDVDYLKKYYDGSLEEALEKLEKGIPVQYIVGNVDFLGNILKVNEKVLIPRFETELLVEKTIDYSRKYLKEPLKIIDLGTGSGAIAISLKKRLNSSVDAIDISLEALEVARENAVDNGACINFFHSDMLDNVDDIYDIIISNPPYIAYDEEVEDTVKNNEPNIALFADNKGLEFYEKILSKANSHLNNPGIIAFEIGMNQGLEIERIARKYFKNADIRIEKDLTGKDRFVFVFDL